MPKQPLSILQVSTTDVGGGAEKVAWNLFQSYRTAGCHSWLAVGYKQSADVNVLMIPDNPCRNWWNRLWLSAGRQICRFQGKVPGAREVYHFLSVIGDPRRSFERWRGLEDFNFPGSWRLLQIMPELSDIIHCHNLHGGYFDMRLLPWMSQQVPVILTLHDAWLLSGHCAHSFDCERWMTGCGHCPDLTIYPAIHRDATAYNWRRKKEIYAKSRLYVATPSRWLMQKVEQSMLAPAVVEARVIPNGLDVSVFRPADKRTVRAALGIPQDARVLLFTAHGIRRNIWKDYQTLRAAVTLVAEGLHGQGVLFIALGEDAPAESVGQVEVRFVPYQKDPEAVARYYQAADVYVQASRADTFPNTVLEALACGTPVVATAVGGIPEQVKGLQVLDCGMRNLDLNRYERDEATGVLVPPGDAEAMAEATVALLSNEALRKHLGQNAARDALNRFDLKRQVEAYLQWYHEIIEHRNMER